MGKRNPKVDTMVRSAVATIIESEVADPRVQLVTITEVQVTPDHEHATVWYTTIDPDIISPPTGGRGGSTDRMFTDEEVAAGLEAAKGRIRTLLGQRARLRRTPALKFVHDPVQAQASKVEELLRKLNRDG